MEETIMTYDAIFKILTDPADLRKRALMLTEVDKQVGLGMASFTKNFNGKGSDRYFWEDGAGNEGNIIFKADGVNDDSILIFAYDHESFFNFYDNNAEEKQIVFNGIPASFKHLLEGDELKWDWEKETKIVYATSAIWHEHNDTTWHINPDFAEQVEKEGENGGFLYVFDLFTRPLDSERLVKTYEDFGYSQEELTKIEDVYKKFYTSSI